MSNWILSVELSLFLAILAIALRFHTKTWLSISGVAAGFWFIYLFLPLLISPNIAINYNSVAYIVTAIFLFCSSTFIIKTPKSIEKPNPRHFNNRFISTIFIIFGLMSLISLVINSYLQGISVQELIFNFFESSSEYVRKRYAGEIKKNIFSQISTISSYMTAISGGLILPFAKSKKTRVIIVTYALLPSVLVMVSQSARGMLFLSIAYLIGGFTISSHSKGSINPIKVKSAFKLLYLLIIAVPIITISFLSKGLYNTEDQDYVKHRIVKYFRSYTSGHLFAFSDWYTHYTGNKALSDYDSVDNSLGFYTFIPIAQALGDDRPVEPGIYTEYFKPNENLQTNIYTIFRGLINDFGLLGSLTLCFATGLILNITLSNLPNQFRSIIKPSVFITFIGFTYTSFIISLFIWNSAYAILLLTSALLACNNTYTQYLKQGKASQ